MKKLPRIRNLQWVVVLSGNNLQEKSVIKDFKIAGKNVQVHLETDADNSVFEEIFVDRDYRILDEIIGKSQNCILDLGAHIGFFSLYCNLINQNVKIFAFEPDERNFSFLKENLNLNHVKNVVAKNIAVGEKTGLRDFYLSIDSHNHSFIPIKESIASKKVNVLSLKDILERYLLKNGILAVDLVKMDLEGAEFEIFENLEGDVFSKIKNFYIEYHEYFENKKAFIMTNILQKNNFKIKTFKSHYDKRMGFLFATK